MKNVSDGKCGRRRGCLQSPSEKGDQDNRGESGDHPGRPEGCSQRAQRGKGSASAASRWVASHRRVCQCQCNACSQDRQETFLRTRKDVSSTHTFLHAFFGVVIILSVNAVWHGRTCAEITRRTTSAARLLWALMKASKSEAQLTFHGQVGSTTGEVLLRRISSS